MPSHGVVLAASGHVLAPGTACEDSRRSTATTRAARLAGCARNPQRNRSQPMIDIVAFVDEGLGHSSYLVDLGDEHALIVDPPRLPDRHIAEARTSGLTIAFTADTHSHADYVSGSPDLGATGATFLAPKDADLEVPHHVLRGDDEIELRPGLVLRAIATPGHTPDHLAYLLCEDGDPVGLFSGGSLMVGTVGRT